jgi:hypothetical protein
MLEAGKVKLNAHIWAKQPQEHYVENQWVARRIFDVEKFDGNVYDPCCGFGRIPEAAKAAGLEAFGCDIVDRGYTYTTICDFLKSDIRADNIVCNPPFNLGEEFARHALKLAERKVALIFPVRRLNAAGKWMKETPLYRLWFLTPRPSMPPGGVVLKLESEGREASGGTIDFCWATWLKGYDGAPTVGWLHRDGDQE